ncbi:atypical membrane-integrating protein (Mistic protein) [Sutcliffiella cohnii]|uniref:Atypical membrane-integrating protein (Mistic protein) n=1 Tax=Sutcliffiella cohnii TaxID=33932 RepID=A0A223KUB7_9BACI|nr:MULTISPECIES: atypical membrane-integrating protein (Mistic protein) [Sutcliffiella]AST93079.1 atypical membrane-integrating protein (Mistic protein) [Sutcliffiella cohnii]MED4016749.1 atypical membrane-integrating protein (Mistic protein) [Sutcliffiella cohnii]WBL14281.1 atypical membrane-integrating protein (Mistic protein) [Sutcliffiella sp. NC1]
MKLNDIEKTTLSNAIDQMNESLDKFIELYNEAEEDKEIITFDEEVVKLIQTGMDTYGEEAITKKINTIVKEVLSLITEQE